MIEIWQAQSEISGNTLRDPSGHTDGLLCREHAEYSMRLR